MGLSFSFIYLFILFLFHYIIPFFAVLKPDPVSVAGQTNNNPVMTLAGV